jgi:nucleoside-diphosphate-sugar epimerase
VTVLLTGASGFVGRATIAAAEGSGLRIRAATRNGADRPAGDTVRIPGLDFDTDWGPIIAGVDTVIHLAARVHVARDRAADPLAYRAVNVHGTVRLAVAAADAGIRRFVFVSTVKVHGETSADGPFTAASPFRPSDPYSRSKAEAEERLREIEARTGLDVVIVRPPLVYGPGVRANFLNLVRAVDRGLPLPLGRVRNRRSFVYVQNLADLLLLLAARTPAAAGRSFLVSDGPPVSTPDLVRRIAAALDRPARLVPVPMALIRAAGRFAGRSGSIDRLLGSLAVDTRDTEDTLGWTPGTTMDQGLTRTARWYRQGV